MEGFYWTSSQRLALERELERTPKASVFRRILALLEVDQGRPVEEVALELRVHRSNVYRWMERFSAEKKPKALERKPGQGRPPKAGPELESLVESALAQPPLDLGYPANGWTLPLLQTFLAVHLPEAEPSLATLRRHLRAMGYVWKRFRYVLAPDPLAAKKNGGFWPKSGLCPSAPRSWRKMRRTFYSFRPCARAGLCGDRRLRF